MVRTVWVKPRGKERLDVDCSERGHLELGLTAPETVKKVGELAQRGDSINVFADPLKRHPAALSGLLEDLRAVAKKKGARVETVNEVKR
jgi:hypothetical protein